MTKRKTHAATRIAVLALAAGGALTLSACEEHAYPSAAPREGTAAAPQGEEALAGAPQGYAPPSTRTPAYIPPPPNGAPYGPPPPGYGQAAAPPPGYGPGYPPPGPPPAEYPQGYGHANPDGAPPQIVTMAPIPNPPERAFRPGLRHRHEHGFWRHAYAAPAYAPVHLHHHRTHQILGATHRAPLSPATAHAHPAVPVHAAPPAAAPAPAPQLNKPAAPVHHRRHHAAPVAAATAAAASGGPTASTSNTTAQGSEADRYQALEKSLRDDFANVAKLQAPAHMEANQTADIYLTLPADFAQTVQTEAGKVGLGSAFSAASLVATLSGDGYTIVPADPLTLPLAPGQATTFHWRATPAGADRSALSVAVKATSTQDNHQIDLGSKSSSSGSATGRVVGIGLLAVVALALLIWAAQRRRPAPTGAVKPRRAAYDQTPPST